MRERERKGRAGESGGSMRGNVPAFLAIAGMLFLMGVHIANPKAAVALVTGDIGTPPEPTQARLENGNRLRIVTWNLRDCAATDPATGERIPFHDEVATILRDLGADVALFQEIQQDDEKGGDIALLQVALARAGWAMPYQASVETGGSDDIAVFSRYRIASCGSVLEPLHSAPAATQGADSGKPWPRPGLHAVIDTGPATLDLYSFHFKAMPDARSETARKAQAKALAGLLREEAAKRASPQADHGASAPWLAVVAGDFNTINPGDLAGAGSTLEYLELRDDKDGSNDFKSANGLLLPGVPTYADEKHSSVTDHILMSRDAFAAMSEGWPRIGQDLPRKAGIPVSDHRPLTVEIALR